MRWLSFFALVAALASVHAQKAELKVGDPAPPLQTSTWLSGKKVGTFEPGKVYVIEFWATWCGSCHVAMPHLEELASKMGGKPVEFIALSSEESNRVEAFLKTKPYKLPVAIDDKSKTFGQYDVHVLPHTVVIDTEGRIAAITAPESVTEKALDDLIAHKKVELPLKSSKPADLDWDDAAGLNANSLGHAVLRSSDSDGGAFKIPPGTGRITADGVSIDSLILIAYGASYTNAKVTGVSGQGPYRVSIKAPDGKDATARTMLRELLEKSFKFNAEWSEIDKTIPVIYYDAAKATVKLKPSKEVKSDGFARHGTIQWTKMPVPTLIEIIGVYGYGMPAFDATGLAGEYDVDLQWVPGNKASLEEAIAKLGLTVKMESRKVRTLFVDVH